MIQQGVGALRRPPDAGYRGAGLRLHQRADTAGATIRRSRSSTRVDTKRARSEVRAQTTQAPLIRKLVARPPTTRTAIRTSAARSSSCSCPSISSRSWAAAARRCSSSTAGPPASRGRCSTADARQRRRPPVGDPRQAAAQAARRRQLPRDGVDDATADDSVLVIGDPACDRDDVSAALRRARRRRRRSPTLLGARETLGGRPHDTASRLRTSGRSSARQTAYGAEPDAHAVINAVDERRAGESSNRRPRRAAADDERPHEPARRGALRRARSSAATKSAHCASCPSWCSSTAAIWPRTDVSAAARTTTERTIARSSRLAWPRR